MKPRSKWKQAEISAGRRLYNTWKTERPDIDFWEYLNEETRKGFADGLDSADFPPTRIVRS